MLKGGRVSRLNKIIDLSTFSQDILVKFIKKIKKLFLNNYKIFINTVSDILNYVGININTVPVLDVRRKKITKINFRSFFFKNQNKYHQLVKYVLIYIKKKNLQLLLNISLVMEYQNMTVILKLQL